MIQIDHLTVRYGDECALVDPENRLVARTLETDWNERLQDLADAQKAYAAQHPTDTQIISTAAQMKDVVSHLAEHWFTEAITERDKKDLLRCLIERVFLERQPKIIRVRVQWYGGGSSELDVPKYLFSAPHLYHRIRNLAREHPDAEIAEILNHSGVKTIKGRPWTARRVMDFRRSNVIASEFTTQTKLRSMDSGYVTSAEAAAQLEVSQSTIQKWYKAGIVCGKHAGGQTQLWILGNDEMLYRLKGNASLDARMVSVRSLCRTQHKSFDEVIAWTMQTGHGLYRLRRGTELVFFVLPAESSVPQ
jgi:hypothetical protein